MLVLLVDDSDVMRALTVKQLSALGHTVHVVSNGWHAVLSAEGTNYGAILMDVQMPVMDGWDATRMIRQSELQNNKPHTPIIAITAIFDRDTCLASEMDDFLPKPVCLSQLQSVLKRWQSVGETAEGGNYESAHPSLPAEHEAF